MKPIEEAARLLGGGSAVAFTGAGISAESGIPTFRDAGGLWERFDPEEFGTWEGLMELAMSRPDHLAAFLGDLRSVFTTVRPGPAHDALARLEAGGILDGVVTQNVDGLHQEAGSRRVIEVHGSLSRRACLRCGHRAGVSRADFLEGLDRAILGLRTAFIPSLASLLPRCPRCGGPARPDFVAFREPVRDMDEARRLVEGAGALLVVGTHGEVFPASELPQVARRRGAPVVDVAPRGTGIRADVRIGGEAGIVLPALADLLLA